LSVTISKIAELSGVSRGTVDRVLNNRGNVKPELQEKIKNIATELGYKPNALAKALVTRKKKYLIGIIINSVGNHFFDDVLLGIEAAKADISDYGIHVMIKKVKGYNAQKQLDLIDELLADGVNAIALTPINEDIIAQKLNDISQSIPVVAFNNDIEQAHKLAFVGCDYYKSGKTAGELMGKITEDPCTVGIITGSLKMLGHNKRIEGFREIIESEYSDIQIADIAENNDDEQTSYEVTQQLLINNRDITALYFTAGGVEGGLRAVCERNLAHKLKIITFDATPVIRSNIEKGVIDFTICQRPYLQGYTSVKVLSDYLVSGIAPKTENIYLDIEIKLKSNL
jgi:LacI family transcriptional regulator